MKKIIFTLCILLPACAFAQPFERVFPADSLLQPCYTQNSSYGRDLDTTVNGIISLARFESGILDSCADFPFGGYVLTHLLANGDSVYSRKFAEPSFFTDGFGSMNAISVDADADGSIYVTGNVMADPQDSQRVFVAKHDASGQLLWSQTFVFGLYSHGLDILADSGNIYISGNYQNSLSGDLNPLILKLDAAGNTVWSYLYTNATVAGFHSILKQAPGSYFLVGTLTPDTSLTQTNFVFSMKFDAAGNVTTPVFYGNATSTYTTPAATINAAQNLMILMFNYTGYQNQLLETDGANLISQVNVQNPSLPDFQIGYALVQTSDLNYVICGNRYLQVPTSIAYYTTSIFLEKIDAAGNLIWQKEYAGEREHVNGGFLEKGDSLLFTGWRNTPQLPLTWMQAALVVKTDVQGNSQACDLSFYLQPTGTEYPNVPQFAYSFYAGNISSGIGPFTWYLNGVQVSQDIHIFVSPTSPGWQVVTLEGCNGNTVTDSVYVEALGTETPGPEATIQVFPNPATDLITLKTSDPDMHTLQIYTLTGACIQTLNFSQQIQWDVRAYPAGMYMYTIDEKQHGRFLVTGK